MFILLLQSPASTTSAIGHQPDPDEIAFRLEFGFSTDASYVISVGEDPDADRSWGVPLTSSEAHEMERRAEIQTSVGALVGALQHDPAFAGAYVDQAAGLAVIVQFRGDGNLSSTDRALVPFDAEVRVVQVTFSLSDLETEHDRVDSDLPRLLEQGISITRVGVDIPSNRLQIAVAASVAATDMALESQYGPEVSVVVGDSFAPAACNSREDCGSPIKGGLHISAQVPPFIHNCTSGFLGRDAEGSAQKYVLTAGHCLDGSGLGATWKHNGASIGKGAFENYFSGTNADVGGTSFAEALMAAKNQVYGANKNDIKSMTALYTNAQQTQGATICRSGYVSGWTCGTIAYTNQTITYGSIVLHHMWISGFPSQGGDSGGSMINGTNKAGGILSGTSDTQTSYSTTGWISTAAGVVPCLSISC